MGHDKIKKEVKFESKVSSHDAAEIIDALVTAIREGQIKVQKNENILHLAVPEFVNIEVEASEKEDKVKFEIELSWSKSDAVRGADAQAESAGQCQDDSTQSREKAKASAKAAVHSAQEAFKEVGKVFAQSGESASKALRETFKATKVAVKDSAKAAKEMAEATIKLKSKRHKGEESLQELLDSHKETTSCCGGSCGPKCKLLKHKEEAGQKSLPASEDVTKSHDS